MTTSQRSLLGGISILGIAGLICKVVGVLYRIPLANLIGSEGIGVYQQVFPSYNLLLTISSAGIPVAISRMVASYLALGQIRSTKRIFELALLILTALGVFSTALMLLFSPQLARATGTMESVLGFRFIAPSVLLVCVMSAFRGYMQGQRRMVPTAVSQLIEQVGKIGVALPLANSFMLRGGYAMGAAGALLGTTIAEAAALLYMAVDYVILRPQLAQAVSSDLRPPANWRRMTRELIFSAVPITIGACIVPLAGTVDSFMLVRLMQAYLPEADALSNYGIYSGLVIPLINVPTALAMAMASNLVPSISSKRASGDLPGIRRDAASGLRLALVIGLPSSVGMSLLAEPILFLLFGGGKYTSAQLQLGGQLLSVSALTIAVFTLVQASSGILQGLYKQRIPMYTLFAGIAVNIMIEYAAVRDPGLNIFGAPWSSLACYILSASLNIHYVAKYAGMRIDLRDLILRPALATMAMAVPVLGATLFLKPQLRESWLLMGLTVMTAVIVFIAAAVKAGAVKQSDLPARFRKGL